MAKDLPFYIDNYPFGHDGYEYTVNDLKVIQFKKGYMKVEDPLSKIS